MRALTITQPWAGLIAASVKLVENRPRRIVKREDFGKVFAIHASREIDNGGRIAIVHYITPKPVKGTTFVKAFGLSTGFDMPMRAVSIYQRDNAELALGGGT